MKKMVIIALIGAMSISLLTGCGKKGKTTADYSSVGETLVGVAMLQQLEQGDVSQAEATIEQARAELNAQQNEEAKDAAEAAVREAIGTGLSEEQISQIDYKELFQYCVVMGDSITDGISGYGHLNNGQVISKTGISMVDTDEHLAQAAALNPRRIFLSYGSNDISGTHYDYDTFRTRFDDFLTRAENACPNAELYVNSIFPATAPLTTKQPWYTKTAEYNQVMREVCEAHEITFIDNTSVVKSNYYAPDGYHFKSEMYPFWLYNMAKSAGLVE